MNGERKFRPAKNAYFFFFLTKTFTRLTRLLVGVMVDANAYTPRTWVMFINIKKNFFFLNIRLLWLYVINLHGPLLNVVHDARFYRSTKILKGTIQYRVTSLFFSQQAILIFVICLHTNEIIASPLYTLNKIVKMPCDECGGTLKIFFLIL